MGESGYMSAKHRQTPFAWIPASRADASFDAVICTDTHIITIQATVSAKHDMKPIGFERLKKNLPDAFQKVQSWCHVFVTDRDDAAAKLGRKRHPVPDNIKILIHTMVLDISLFQYDSDALHFSKVPDVSRRKLLYNHFGTYLSHQVETDRMEVDNEEGE